MATPELIAQNVHFFTIFLSSIYIFLAFMIFKTPYLSVYIVVSAPWHSTKHGLDNIYPGYIIYSNESTFSDR